MDQDLKQIHSFILLYLEGQLSSADQLQLDRWKDAHPDNRQLFEELTDGEVLRAQLSKLHEVDTAAALERFKLSEYVRIMTPIAHRMPFLRRWGWAAAGVILIISTAMFLVVSSDRPANTKATLSHTAKILPGKNGAILTLADGSQVLLDSIQNGVIALQGGATAKIVNGTLQYEGYGSEVVYNTMSTPKGRQFHLILPDGTEVWLNSASTIRYPTAFAGNVRSVEITGEAYFEVAKNKKMPFKLRVNNKAEVEVLGTQFNVNAYQNEKTINTTLMEGSVRVQAGLHEKLVGQKTQPGIADISGHKPSQALPSDQPAIILKPGQQAQIANVNNGWPEDETTAKTGIKVINRVDMEKVLAWKNGVFNFNNTDFEAAMRQLERWYDIEVVYPKGTPPKIELYGEMTKDVTLNDLLKGLSEIGVKCQLEDRKLLIQ